MDHDDEHDLDEQLLDLDDFGHDGRTFVTARLAPHPTAIKVIFEIPDEGEPEVKPAADLVATSSDPYFWVEKFGELLREYINEVRERLDSIVAPELDELETQGPLQQAFAADSAVGRAARQSAVGVRALASSFAEAVFHASSALGWPNDASECAQLLELFMDATIAAATLEQLGGQPAIPEDVIEDWDPNGPADYS